MAGAGSAAAPAGQRPPAGASAGCAAALPAAPRLRARLGLAWPRACAAPSSRGRGGAAPRHVAPGVARRSRADDEESQQQPAADREQRRVARGLRPLLGCRLGRRHRSVRRGAFPKVGRKAPPRDRKGGDRCEQDRVMRARPVPDQRGGGHDPTLGLRPASDSRLIPPRAASGVDAGLGPRSRRVPGGHGRRPAASISATRSRLVSADDPVDLDEQVLALVGDARGDDGVDDLRQEVVVVRLLVRFDRRADPLGGLGCARSNSAVAGGADAERDPGGT